MGSRIWTRDFTLAVVTNTFVSLVFYMLMSAMTLYAVEEFAASDTLAGLTSSMFIIGALAARVFAGKLLDVVGRRRMLLISLVVFVLASLAYAPTGSIGLLLAIRFVHGVAFGAGNTAVAASVQAIIPPQRRSEGTGYFGLSTTVAMAIGPLLAVTWGASGNWTAIFVFCAVASAIGFLVAFVMRLPERPVSAEERAGWWRLRFGDVIHLESLPVAMVMLFTGMAYSSILTFLAAYAVSEEMPAAASSFFLVYAATVLVARLVVGRVQDRLGDNAVMLPTMLSFVLALLVIAWAPNGATLAFAGVLGGLGFGAMMSCAQAIVVARATPATVGVVTSTFFLMLDLGSGVGPVLLGGLVQVAGFNWMYVAMAALVLATVGFYWLVHGRYERAPAVLSPVAPAPGRGRVLVGVDGSDDALRALRYARHAAAAEDLDVWLVSVVDDGSTAGEWASQASADELTELGQGVLDRAVDVLGAMGWENSRVVTELVTGHAASALVTRSSGARLVLGRRSSGGLERLVVGSTSLAVVAGADCPVVVISDTSTPHETGGHELVTVAVGPRGGGRGALRWGFEEAARRGARLRVVHVMRASAVSGASTAAVVGASGAVGLVALDEAVAAHPEVRVEILAVDPEAGSPVDNLVALTAESDLLVLDAHPSRTSGLPLAGAVREVLTHAHCPVVLTS